MTVRLLILAGALALTGAAPAAAARDVSLTVDPVGGVRLGRAIDLRGTATDGTTPLAGRTVRLEVRRFPYTGAFKERGETRTDGEGDFAFAPKLDRNHEVRARLVGRGVLPGDGAYTPPEGDVLSIVRDVYVLPAFTLDFEQLRKGLIRVSQVYSVPRDVKLTKATRFYVGPCRLSGGRCTAKRAPLKAVAKTKKLRKGRYRARAKVRIPARFDGRFQYVSCFPYSPGSGMGDPDLRCPKKRARIR
ncbi:MAG TPA: hypothetical protein VD836_10090 [Solirubrobacteraceae bacterium]|jgi:hypothetical protein|nr:hypothetical protein [Solirubrobacteraceae bacterium]